MSLLDIMRQEMQNILRNHTIVLTLFGGLLFYSFLYPRPYLNQFLVEQKIVVINNDNSALSRKLLRMVDASPQVKIVGQVFDRKQAQNLMDKGKIAGLLIVPENFYRDILLRRSPTLVYVADASYFLIYGTIVEGITNAAATLDAQILFLRQLTDKHPIMAAQLENRPVFNPNTGYLAYVIPPIFLLILQQVLLVVSGIHSSSMANWIRDGGKNPYPHCHPLFVLLGRVLVFLFLAVPFFLLYFGVCFSWYNVPHLASVSGVLFLVFPFLLATILLGCCIGMLIPRIELVTFSVLTSSLPLVFSEGFVWPREMLPFWIKWLAQWAPFSHAANALFQLNQFGADFYDIRGEFWQLWALVFLFAALSIILTLQLRKRQPSDKKENETEEI